MHIATAIRNVVSEKGVGVGVGGRDNAVCHSRAVSHHAVPVDCTNTKCVIYQHAYITLRTDKAWKTEAYMTEYRIASYRNGRTWSGLTWLRTGISDGFLWTRQWIFWLHSIRRLLARWQTTRFSRRSLLSGFNQPVPHRRRFSFTVCLTNVTTTLLQRHEHSLLKSTDSK